MGKTERPNLELTSAEKDALRFISAYLAEYRKMPTMKQLAAHMGATSAQTGQRYVDVLKKKGFLEEQQVVVTALSDAAKKAVRIPTQKP